MLNIQLASLLQHLDFISPDGGLRVPEAEAAYRCMTACLWPGLLILH